MVKRLSKKSKKTEKKRQRIMTKQVKPDDTSVCPPFVGASPNEKSFAVFNVGKERFAIDLDAILEILHTFSIISAPHLPEMFSGVINVREGSIPVISLQELLKEEKIETVTRACLVTSIDSLKIGFLIDSDIEIVTSTKGSLHPLPDCYTKEEAEFLDGIFWVKDKFIGILKPKKMIEILSEWREDNEKI